jgi:hypothetical protein
MDPVRRTGHEGELAIYFVGRRLYVLHAFAPKGDASAGEFFYISKLVSSAIKADRRSRVWVRQVRGDLSATAARKARLLLQFLWIWSLI